MSRADFWPMSIDEFFWLYDVKRSDIQHIRLLYDSKLRALIGEPV